MADPIHDHCRVVGCKCGGAARADAQAVDPTDLTPAEQAAADAIRVAGARFLTQTIPDRKDHR